MCLASAEQCQQKYGYLIEQWDVFDKSIKKLAADKTLPGEFRDYLPAVYMMDTEAQGIAVEYGWTKRFETMGLDTETAQIVAAALPSLVGTPNGRKAGNGKEGVRQPSPNVNQYKEQIAAGKNAAEAPPPSVSTKELLSAKLSETQRLDKNRELISNFTWGSNRLKKTEITIDAQVYKANPELSKGAVVFDNVSQAKVVKYYKELAGVELLPKPRLMAETLDIYGNPGILYSVKHGNVSYTLRSGSSSADKTRAKWTIEISGIQRTEINGRILTRDKIEVKFK